MEQPHYILLKETKSTNSYLQEISADAPHGTVVAATSQTAGRGQRGNSWESEAGKNITMSMLLRPSVLPSRQFLLSEAAALAVVHTLDGYLGDGVSVKWPNDVYYGDRKICGLLIEHSLSGGKISHTIAGIGLNVNQREFLSDAPNPVSLYQVTGRDTPVGEVRCRLAEELLRLCALLPGQAATLHEEFLSRLYRRDGFFRYRSTVDAIAAGGDGLLPAGSLFEGRIADVAPDGILSLSLRDGTVYRFAFKEVEFLIGQ